MNFFKNTKINYYIEAVISTAIGIVLMVWPGATLDFLVKALAALIFCAGIVFVIGFFMKKERGVTESASLSLGVIIAVIGAWMFSKPNTFIAIIPIIAGIVIAMGGISNITQAVSLGKYKYSKWWLSLIFGIISIILGGYLILNPLAAADSVMMIIGFTIVYTSITNVWALAILGRVEKNVRQQMEAVDTEAEIIDYNK